MTAPDADMQLRVASVPGAVHPYVAGLGLPEAGVVVLADPPVDGAPAGRWWPPAMLDPAWIAANADRFDVMHVHFATESLSSARLAEVIAALRAAGRPLVHTIHDLSHPQLADQAAHVAQLDLLVPAADALITLTDGAADEVRRRWGRRPMVLAHPAMRPHGADLVSAAKDAFAPVIGVHLRDLRPGIDGPGTVATLAAALADLPAEVTGRVWMRDRTRDAVAAAEVRRLCASTAGLQLVEQPRVDDVELEGQVGSLAVSVLPYRHGTHSGWLELCWDLGVPVAGPALGHLGDQHPDPGFFAPYRPGDAASLAAALETLLASPASCPGAEARRAAVAQRRSGRVALRRELGRAHVRLYRSLVAESATAAGRRAPA